MSAWKAAWGKTTCPGREDAIQLSYTWVKLALQGAGLVVKQRKRGKNSKRRPQRSRTGLIEFYLPRSPIGPPLPLLDQKISGKW